eukprot:CAMPEP_0197036860 /NCGR_PEP_ID=MMETSP1384-20130603/14235_1 /TAXON_ID=29189 /ORGANISM="Ammonia sp." /LENGTH=316 /DNA_ID=CAMNT_0042467083 /DNA_START=43 /DNA_END=993 /DNA_ORIENTATION=+
MADTEMAEVEMSDPSNEASAVKVNTSDPDEDLSPTDNQSKLLSASLHMVVLAVITAICVPLAHRTSLRTEQIVGIAYLLIYSLYVVCIWYFFCKAEYLHRIYTHSEIPPEWAPMSIAKRNVPKLEHPITSISEFSAIAGGVAKMMLARIGTITWGILITLIMTQIKNEHIHVRVSLVLECMGAYGMDMIGTFYYDPRSKGMRLGHHIGLALAIFCLIGFWMQQLVDVPNRNKYVADDERQEPLIWLCVILTVFFVIFFGLFEGWDKLRPFQPPKDPAELKTAVTKRAKLDVGFETVGLGMLVLSFSLYFILYPPEW